MQAESKNNSIYTYIRTCCSCSEWLVEGRGREGGRGERGGGSGTSNGEANNDNNNNNNNNSACTLTE